MRVWSVRKTRRPGATRWDRQAVVYSREDRKRDEHQAEFEVQP